MNLQTTELLSGSSISVAVLSGVGTWLGWFEYINANAPGLGFISSLFFGIIGIVFYWLSLKKERLANHNKTQLDKHIKDTGIEFKKIKEKFTKLTGKD